MPGYGLRRAEVPIRLGYCAGNLHTVCLVVRISSELRRRSGEEDGASIRELLQLLRGHHRHRKPELPCFDNCVGSQTALRDAGEQTGIRSEGLRRPAGSGRRDDSTGDRIEDCILRLAALVNSCRSGHPGCGLSVSAALGRRAAPAAGGGEAFVGGQCC